MERIGWWRTSFGEAEIDRLRVSVLNEHISQGPVTEEFEADIARSLNVPYVIVTTSGSAAIYLALASLGLTQGDEVIIPDRTWIATAHAVMLTGATPVLCDVRSDIPVLDLEDVERKITAKTKVLLPVHLNGRATDMSALKDLAKQHGLFVVEDACQALFSKSPLGYLGTTSDAGCFSLGTTKLIATGQGGFVVTHDKARYESLKLLRNHGVSNYYADKWNCFGFNFKFTDLLASFGIEQLKRAKGRIEHCRQVYLRYQNGLSGLQKVRQLPICLDTGELPLYAEFLSPVRSKIMEYLADNNVQTRAVPPNVHISTYIPNDGLFPHAELFSEQGFYLPCGPEQPFENVDKVIHLLEAYEDNK